MSGIIRRDGFWDRVVFNKLQNILGGQVKLCIIGSAPMSSETLNFVKCAFGCYIMEGYGQTEGTAAMTIHFPGERFGGHVGGPLVCNYMKLVDIPEMGYFATDGKGEVCCKGANVFQGYYKDPKKTAEAFDKDGWLRTGEVGMWLPNGALRIIDRKKNIFKLAQGEYVAPEKIEAIYTRSQFVGQVFIDGRSLKSCCMGIAVPDPEVMADWAPTNGFPSDMNELCQSKKVKDIILQDLHKEGKKAGLFGFEQVKDIYLHPEPFSVQNGLLTPTFKGKRIEIRKLFQNQIDTLYALNNM